MNAEVEANIRSNVSWSKLPNSVKQQLGNSSKEYEKCVVTWSVKNQQRFRGNLIRQIRKDEKKYYEDLMDYSRKSLMLFPYHLSDVIIKGLMCNPFGYYVQMLESLMAQEKSYDSLPNFTAADCLRLLGIGRNQYIDLMNQSRSSKKFGGFFSRKSGKDLLPTKPVETITILPWWMVQVGYITEDDMKSVDKAEHSFIDQLIDKGSCPAGHVDYTVVFELFRRGLIYFDVPIEENDYVIVPPLEGFVMNRVLGDYFETLLYKIFVSIDENTNVSELAAVLEIDVNLVRDAVSLYCRVGFAKKKNCEVDSNDLHPSWYDHGASAGGASGQAPGPTVERPRRISVSSDEDDSLLRELNQALETDTEQESLAGDFVKPTKEDLEATSENEVPSASAASSSVASSGGHKKIAFLFDSTLTAYLMMGNLSPGLKNHAVTMFEVGKLSDESLDSLVSELEKVSNVEGEGEAARYFSHALTLRDTILFLRQNPGLKAEGKVHNMCLGLDLIRCESLQSLDPNTASRLLNKNYSLLVSMAPLSNEIRPVSGCFPPHLGPAIPEVSSTWFKMFLYHVTGSGPPSLLLAKGTRLRRLPALFERCSRLLVTTWGHDPSEIPLTGALTMLLDALQHSAILVQALCKTGESEAKTKTVAFPISAEDEDPTCRTLDDLKKLESFIDIKHSCGYVTLLDINLEGVTKKSYPEGVNALNAPKNGDVTKENAQLLEEEIDSLEEDSANQDQEETKTNPKKKIKSMRLELEEASGMRSSQQQQPNSNWILLDLNFGIPLFDADLNKRICERITSNGLWKRESLDLLSQSSSDLCRHLMEFISEFQVISSSQDCKSDCSNPKNNKFDPALPTKSLFFDGAHLRVWDGR